MMMKGKWQYVRKHEWVVRGWKTYTMAEHYGMQRNKLREENKYKMLCFNCIYADAEYDRVHCRRKYDMVIRPEDKVRICILFARGD